MSRRYDIAERLMQKNQSPTIVIDEDHEIRINTSAPAAMMIQSIAQDDDKDMTEYERMGKIITVAIGKEAWDYIESQEYSLTALSLVVMAIMAAISDESLEKIEEEMGPEKEGVDEASRFRHPQKKSK